MMTLQDRNKLMHLIENANYTGAEVNGDEIDNPQSQVSQSSRDESSAHDMSTEDSPFQIQGQHSGGRVLILPYLSMYWALNSTLQFK